MGNSDSRTILRDHIQQLVNEDISDDGNDFWPSLFTLESTIEDINSMVSEDDIGRLISDYRNNYIKLLDYSIQILEESYNQVLSLDSEQIICTSNAVKILARIIPISYKFPVSENLWWETSRAFRAIRSSVGLLHTQVYTVYASLSIEKSDGIILAMLWKEGLLLRDRVPDVPEPIWQRRFELLALVKNLISDIPLNKNSSRTVDLLINDIWFLQTVYSVLNTLICFNPYGFWNLPYASYVRSPNMEKAIKIGLQVVCMLNFTEGPIGPKGNKVKNAIAGIRDRGDLISLWKAIKDVLNSVYIAKNTYLPGSQKPFKLEDEILLLLFTLVKENDGFLQLVVYQKDMIDILFPIFHILLQVPDQFICVICAYIIIKFSEHRRFCVSLNAPVNNTLLDLPLFTGNYGDLLIITFSKLILSKNPATDHCSHLFLTAICNISPVLKTICPISSHNLIKLLQDFSLASWSESEPEIHAIRLLLEIINNFVQYQWRGSCYLVYWLLQNSSMIYKINKISSPKSKEFSDVCEQVVQSFKEMKGVEQEQFAEIFKQTTLVGILPLPHQIVSRKITFEDKKMLSCCLKYFYHARPE